MKRLSIIISLLIISQSIFSQSASRSRDLYSRFSFYSFEKSGEALLKVPPAMMYSKISVNISINDEKSGSWSGIPGSKMIRIPIAFSLKPSSYIMNAEISSGGSTFVLSAPLIILGYKSNEVKIDRLTGSLIVNKHQFFPFGFYCYSPVNKTLPEEEVVKGFNMMSPYQKILPESLSERKSYMDRCAQLGMKVHYNILSVSGGGGVNSKIEGYTSAKKKELLINEIKAFRDHPALLAWYIADEPNGNKIEPDSLKKVYDLVRELDPWHPASVVFTAPFMSAVKYADALDVVMADPYPVPDLPVSFVGNLAARLSEKFNGEKPLWMVLQTFGGGEIWKREPTWQEIRSMTYQAIINGSTGIQYFIRQGLNLFPKSVPLWNECGKMAVEIAEMTPWLLSEEESRSLSTGTSDISARSFMHDGKLLVLAVNKNNAPARASISIPFNTRGKADLIFENRSITINGSALSDILSPYGSQAYMIDIKPAIENHKPWADNLLPDPGFEDNSSPGVPSACYARGNGERGATYFTDTREHLEGDHSVKFVTPSENGSARLRFYPFRVRPGASYIVSVWAKSDPEQGLNQSRQQYMEVTFGDYDIDRFPVTSEWQQYYMIFKVPYFDETPSKINISLQMPSAGVCWLDLVQAAECSDIGKSIDPDLNLPF
jgi:hypothetical protein